MDGLEGKGEERKGKSIRVGETEKREMAEG